VQSAFVLQPATHWFIALQYVGPGHVSFDGKHCTHSCDFGSQKGFVPVHVVGQSAAASAPASLDALASKARPESSPVDVVCAVQFAQLASIHTTPTSANESEAKRVVIALSPRG